MGRGRKLFRKHIAKGYRLARIGDIISMYMFVRLIIQIILVLQLYKLKK
jgi:hypothetical protein